MMSTPKDLFGCCTFDFISSVPDELELHVGYMVKILKDIDEFWYSGQNLLDGKKGLFPKDFVNIVEFPKVKDGEKFLFAIDTFFPEVNNDLPFKKGDVIVLSYKVDSSWGYGRCNGKEGIFPLNYTQTFETEYNEDISDRSEALCNVTAMMSLTAQIEGELSFEVGDQITVTKIMPDEWAFGYIGEQSGTFPLSFTSYSKESKNSLPLTKLQEAKSSLNDHHAYLRDIKDKDGHSHTSSKSVVKPLNNNCTSFSVTKDQQLLTIKHEQPISQSKKPTESFINFDSCFTNSTGLDSGYNSNDLKEHQKQKQGFEENNKKLFVIANFSHFGRASDELSFKKGDVIEVLDYKSEMWLNGKLHGSAGLVPRNFVSEYIYSENGHSEISSDIMLSKFKLLQKQSSSSPSQKDHTKQESAQTLYSQADIRLVMQDFKALTDFELSVNVGDTVHVLNQINLEWCKVKNSKAQVGFVPASCLQQVKTISKRSSSTNPTTFDQIQSNNASNPSPRNLIIKDDKGSSKPLAHSLVPSVSRNKSPSTSTAALNSITSSVDLSVSTSKNSTNRRHSDHTRKSSSNKKSISKSQSMRVRNRDITLNSTPLNLDNGKRTAFSKTEIRYSDLLKSQAAASNESDNISVTSHESIHSSTLPSSSCSSTCSDKTKLTSSSNSESVIKKNKSRRATRSAPPTPIQIADQVSSDQSSNCERLSQINLKVASPPSRPPEPTAVVKSNFQILSDDKLNPAEQKDKIEKIRLEIEEYSRMQKNLEADYNSTYDGKARLEISEEKQLVAAKLKRLRMELHNLICDVIGATGSTERNVHSVKDESIVSSPPPPTSPPPPAENLAEIKEKRLAKRKHVIRELIKTEEDYLQDVVITINDIMKPLLERELPIEFKLDTVFGNIEDIRDCSRKFLNCFKKEEANLSSAKDSSINVGRVFIDNAPQMKEVYKIYCRNHDDATALLEKYEADPEFQVPVQEYLAHVRSKINAFDLGSFLIKPVQRILKYPLLLQELLKLTDVPHPGEPRQEYDELIKAVKLIQEVANDINEDKRRKDLVRKYLKGSQEANFAEKIARFSLHSVRKKSARISLRLSHVTGFNQPETVDEKFNSLEQRFKNVEKTIKSFLNNSDNFGHRYRDLLNIEHVLAEHMGELWASDSTPLVESYMAAMARTATHLYRQFHTQTQLRVHTPLSALLQQFKGPQALIEKRFDKLLDYENCQKSSDSKEKIQMAKNVYEALNMQLIDELPTLCDLSCKLLDACVALNLHFQINLQRNLLEVAEPVLKLCRNTPNAKELDKRRIMEVFNVVRNQVLVNMRHFTIIPSSFSTLTSSVGRGHGSSTTTAGASTFFHQSSPSVKQSEAQRESLLKKYKPEDLYVATDPHSSPDKMSLSCSPGDVLAVIKRQDPLGNVKSWYCDDGVNQGFLPSTILLLYSSRPSASLSPTSSPVKNPALSNSPVPRPAESESTAKSSPGTRKTSTTGSSLQEASANLPDHRRSGREQFRLDYNFAARSTLELSVKEGEVVDLIEESDMDGNREWWLVANLQGKQGYVPANYMSRVQYL